MTTIPPLNSRPSTRNPSLHLQSRHIQPFQALAFCSRPHPVSSLNRRVNDYDYALLVISGPQGSKVGRAWVLMGHNLVRIPFIRTQLLLTHSLTPSLYDTHQNLPRRSSSSPTLSTVPQTRSSTQSDVNTPPTTLQCLHCTENTLYPCRHAENREKLPKQQNYVRKKENGDYDTGWSYVRMKRGSQ